MAILQDDFRAALGLWDGHAQSLFGVLRRPTAVVRTRRERRETPDGDFVDLDWVDGRPGAPTVLVLHGLEGSAASGYVQLTLREVALRGWTGVAINARSCSGELNRQPASYSSGDYRDLAWLVKTLERPLYAVGFSLGGSVLLNFLAKDEGAQKLEAAVAVSVPYDLQLGARFLDAPALISSRYLARFLPAMKQKALAKAKHHPGAFDVEAIAAAKTIRDFDHLVTARHFGFQSAEHYYQSCSAGPLLENIRTRTLLISAADDALAPPVWPATVTQNSALDVLKTKRGGHVGFVGGSLLAPRFWVEERAVRWLATQR